MISRLKLYEAQILDTGILAAISGFAFWVVAWHSAHLAAPTVAIATAAIATYKDHTAVKKVYELVFVIGMIVTAFMWLISTTEGRTQLAPASPAEGWVIVIGWAITVYTIMTATLLTLLPVNYFTRIPKHPKRKMLFDYTAGIVASVMVTIPSIAVMLIVETSIGQPGDVQESAAALVLLAPLYGCLFTYALRNKPSSVWSPPADATERKK